MARRWTTRYVYDPITCGRLKIHGPAPRGFVAVKPAKCGGFGSPTAVHEHEAPVDTRNAVRLARTSSRQMARDCRTAFANLRSAIYYAGQANAGAISAGHGAADTDRRFRSVMRIARRADDAVNRAADRFDLVCVVGPAPVRRRGRR